MILIPEMHQLSKSHTDIMCITSVWNNLHSVKETTHLLQGQLEQFYLDLCYLLDNGKPSWTKHN